MGWFEAIVLGIVQGLTEFLPISSSAHVSIAGQLFFQGRDPGAAFTAVTQLGTETAVLVYFWHDIVRIIKAWFGSLIGRVERGDDPESGGSGHLVTGEQGVLDRRGAAPGGQQREVEVDETVRHQVEQGLRQQRAVRHHRAALGRDLGQPRQKIGVARLRGLQSLDAQVSGSLRHRARLQLLAPPAGGIRAGEDGDDLVLGGQESLQAGQRDLRGSGKDDAHRREFSRLTATASSGRVVKCCGRLGGRDLEFWPGGQMSRSSRGSRPRILTRWSNVAVESGVGAASHGRLVKPCNRGRAVARVSEHRRVDSDP